MAKYVIDSETLEGLGDAIRSVTGSTKKFTPEEMIEEVKDILNATTFILVDKDGNEYPAVYVDSDTVITATPNDIRKGTTAITAEGVIEGEKEIPAYYTNEGCKLIPSGSAFRLYVTEYGYTKLQAIICPFNTSVDASVRAEKVVIENAVYPVQSTEAESDLTIDESTNIIDFGIVNISEQPCLIRYFSYKEIY